MFTHLGIYLFWYKVLFHFIGVTDWLVEKSSEPDRRSPPVLFSNFDRRRGKEMLYIFFSNNSQFTLSTLNLFHSNLLKNIVSTEAINVRRKGTRFLIKKSIAKM